MKKILTLIIALIAISLSTGDAQAFENTRSASAQLARVEVSKPVMDMRVKALQNVFAKYNSELTDSAWAYVKYADQYGVDWRLLPSIAGLESTFAKRYIRGTYNPYGWGSGRIYFESWEDGIRTINKALSEKYMARGATDVWSIGPIYAESPTWSVRVNSFMEEIEEEYKRLSLFSSLTVI